MRLKHLDELVYIRCVQTGGRFVQDVNGSAGRPLGKLGRQLDPLRLSARQGGCRLSQLDVTQTDIAQCLNLACDLRDIFKKTAASSAVISSTSLMFLSLYFTSSVSRL